jgi:hypothetical protein
MRRKHILGAAVVLAVAALAAQAIQPNRANPPVNPAATWQAIAKPAPEVLAIVNRSCRDCHTNETLWPWYSRVAPMSWLVARDVNRGRSKLNFSRWDIYSPEMSSLRLIKACDEVRKGEMPLFFYTPLHPEAKLTPHDVEIFCSAAK